MARTEEQDTHDREDLKALLQSPGWQLFVAIVESEYGAEATLAKQEAALAKLSRGDAEGISDTVQQIQVARREVFKMLRLPESRLADLTKKERPAGPFAGLRRVAR